ncbi:MAG TPA: choice-of-anchor D domain-containing protein [Bryobacteraceae bacterium]
MFVVLSGNTAFGSTVNCANSSADAGAIQSAVNAGGAVSISGVCALGSTAISVGNSVVITGTAQLNSSGSFVFVIWSNNVSISGLTFNGAGLNLIGVPQQSGFLFTNNTIRNTNGNNGIVVDGILRTSKISRNTFSSIAPNGFAAATYASLGFGGCYSQGGCDTAGVGISIYGGIDQTTIDNNSFDLIANDAMHIGWNLIAADANYFLTKNNDISYNTFSRVHRIGIEAQAIWSYPKCGMNGASSCDISHNFSTNTTIKGNYFHDPLLTYVETYAYSLAIWGDGQYINNAGIDNFISGQTPGYGIEDMGNNVLTQGNVMAADYIAGATPHGWAADIIYGSQAPGSIFTTQNNVLCGDAATTRNFGDEPNSSGTKVNQYNYIANSCPNAGALTQSAITLAYVSPAVSATNGIWQLSAISALPIRYVQFFLDGSTTPTVTQEVQDVSTTFAADRKWMYHATVNASTLAAGSHTIIAKATDVAGATQSVSQSFNVGSVSTPTLQVAPATLSFGSQTVGLALNMTLTVTAKTGSVTINGINTAGSNSKDFVSTSACGASLAAGLSCTIKTVFTPSVVGAESASLSITDNASGSPQTIALSGTGVALTTTPPPITATSLKSGAYNIRDASGNTMDLGWALNPQWGDGPFVYLYSYNNGASQQITYTSSGQLQSVQSPGQYLYNDGGFLAIGPVGDTFTINTSGNGYTIQDKTAGGLYVQTASAIGPFNKLSLSSTATVWMFSPLATGSSPTSLATGKSYNFQDASSNTMDLGWALNPQWGDGTFVYLYSYNNGASQQITYTAAGQLESVQSPGQYLYNNGGALAIGLSGDRFLIVASGNGYTIYDSTVSLYVNTPGQILPPNKLTLSAAPTVWTATAH